MRFHAASSAGVVMDLEAAEVQMLRQLISEMRMLLEADIPASDDVLQRLFPDAYDDEEEAKAYKELVGNELHAGKRQALDVAEATLANEEAVSVELDEPQSQAWLTLLTDMRLAIGTRLGITEDLGTDDFDPEAPDAAAHQVLHWLGWMQESLLERLSP